ncbi:unnamed protein product [Staurois parvus]|uniref:Secreted protein n=1 Tax=Staurois parvus TaxID=386267 RepID=A0ABN9D523_9NEOB|nr:unnamed protein product [Staurois parvus]
MTLGRKGLTSEAIKGLTVCCFTMCAVCVLLGKHAAVYFCAVQRNTQQHTGLSPVTVSRRSPGAIRESPSGTW